MSHSPFMRHSENVELADKKPKEGSAAEEKAESPAEEAAEKKKAKKKTNMAELADPASLTTEQMLSQAQGPLNRAAEVPNVLDVGSADGHKVQTNILGGVE